MIRLCDKEVCCLVKEEWDRGQLLSYFLNGNTKMPVCVLNKNGTFLGQITYHSLLGNDLNEAVIKDCIILNETVWEYGKKYFRNHPNGVDGTGLLPVVDKKRQLICFAWQDREANREIRMLDELMLCKNAAGFREVFPEYDGVKIYDCNELAYYFLKYLQEEGIPVNVEGTIWKEIGVQQEKQLLDFRTYSVYAEGTMALKEVGQRESVSIEFECIDQIYEENICRGIINDKKVDFQAILEQIRDKKIGILGVGNRSLETYGLLLTNGVDIYCFVSGNQKEVGQKLFGKRIVNEQEVMKLKDIVLIDSYLKNSAWGGAKYRLLSLYGI